MNVSHPTRTVAIAPRWHDPVDADGIPRRMLCPIGLGIMHDPVVGSDGNTYDRPNLKLVLAEAHPVSPLTREPLTHVMVPNGALQREVAAFLLANPDLQEPLHPHQQQAVDMAVGQGVPRYMALAAIGHSPLLPSTPADVLMLQLLQDTGLHAPSTPHSAPSSQSSPQAGLTPPMAPARRTRGAGRLSSAQMQRNPPYARAPVGQTLGAPAFERLNRRLVRGIYNMPETPSPVPPAQVGTRMGARVLWWPASDTALGLSRAAAVGSLAGAAPTMLASPLPFDADDDSSASDLTELASQFFAPR